MGAGAELMQRFAGVEEQHRWCISGAEAKQRWCMCIYVLHSWCSCSNKQRWRSCSRGAEMLVGADVQNWCRVGAGAEVQMHKGAERQMC